MSSVASATSVAGPYQTGSADRIVRPSGLVQTAQAVKRIGNGSQTSSVPTAQKVAANSPQTLPMGVLLSVSQPSSNNSQADSDYQALRKALLSGNLAAAQQAYTRLHSDLVLTQPPAAASQNFATTATGGKTTTGTAAGGILNAVA